MIWSMPPLADTLNTISTSVRFDAVKVLDFAANLRAVLHLIALRPRLRDPGRCGILARFGAWRSLVARTVRVGEVPGSNPGAPICETAHWLGGFVV